MTALSRQILTHAAKLPEGTPLAARELLNFGNRAAIDQALSRLARRGQLIRARRGIYFLPVAGRFGTRPPEPAKVAEALARVTGEVVVPNEAASANALGLSTQVPMQRKYLTSGRSRRLQLGKQVVEFKHAPAWKLRLANRPAGQALRALAGAGPHNVHAMAQKLKHQLGKTHLAELAATPTFHMPGWLAREIQQLRSHD